MDIKILEYNQQSDWELIDSLINNVIHNKVNTTLPVEVVSVNKDKVSVKSLVMPKEANNPPVVYHNILTVLPGGAGFTLHFPVKPGDKGLLIVSKYDLIEFKKTLKYSKTGTNRVFDTNDSFFVPIIFNKDDLNKEEVSITYQHESEDEENASKITFTKDSIEMRCKVNFSIKNEQGRILFEDNRLLIHMQGGEVEIMSPSLIIKSESIKNTPLKRNLDAITSLLEDLAKACTSYGIPTVTYQANKLAHQGTFSTIEE